MVLYGLAGEFWTVLDGINHLVEPRKDVFLASGAGCKLRISQGSLQIGHAHLASSTPVQVLEDGEEL